MIVRIVRMEFRHDRVADFLQLFEENRERIRHFPGVSHLEFYRDLQQPNVFYTLSHWRGEADLEAYRTSELFESVWSRTKALFAAKPQAFSLVKP